MAGPALQKTFLLSAYADEQEARYHELELAPNEGKMPKTCSI
jgi:hypothetical protein